MNAVAPTGYANAIPESIKDRIASPTLPHRDLFAPSANIPITISNIPTTSKIIVCTIIIVSTVIPGCTITNIDNMGAITPRLICPPRIYPGALDSLMASIIVIMAVIVT
jgi:hypothetical protein